MPVVAAARLEGHVVNREGIAADGRQAALTIEELAIGVGFADREENLLLESVLAVVGVGHGLVISPDLLGHIEDGPGGRPARVEASMGNDRSDLLLGHAVLLGVHQVVLEGGVHETTAHEGDDRDDGAGLEVERVVAPDLAEEDIVVVARKIGGELAQAFASRRLHNLGHS